MTANKDTNVEHCSNQMRNDDDLDQGCGCSSRGVERFENYL